METRKQRKRGKRKINLKKVLKVLWYVGFIVAYILVMYNRIQDIHGIEFFFTTWR